jgi:hypothetical protein
VAVVVFVDDGVAPLEWLVDGVAASVLVGVTAPPSRTGEALADGMSLGVMDGMVEMLQLGAAVPPALLTVGTVEGSLDHHAGGVPSAQPPSSPIPQATLPRVGRGVSDARPNASPPTIPGLLASLFLFWVLPSAGRVSSVPVTAATATTMTPARTFHRAHCRVVVTSITVVVAALVLVVLRLALRALNSGSGSIRRCCFHV